MDNGKKYGSDHEMISIQFKTRNEERTEKENNKTRYRFDDTIIDQDIKELIKKVCLREKANEKRRRALQTAAENF